MNAVRATHSPRTARGSGLLTHTAGARCSRRESGAGAAGGSGCAEYTQYDALRAWETLQKRVPVVVMAFASDRWPGGITGTVCMHPDALDAIIADVDAAWHAMRAGPRAALILPLPSTARRVPAVAAVEREGVAGAWRVVKRRAVAALPFEVGGRRGGAGGALTGSGAAPLADYDVRFELVEPRVAGMDFSKAQGHQISIEVCRHLCSCLQPAVAGQAGKVFPEPHACCLWEVCLKEHWPSPARQLHLSGCRIAKSCRGHVHARDA